MAPIIHLITSRDIITEQSSLKKFASASKGKKTQRKSGKKKLHPQCYGNRIRNLETANKLLNPFSGHGFSEAIFLQVVAQMCISHCSRLESFILYVGAL